MNEMPSDFSNDQINPVTGALVKVKNNTNGIEFDFVDQNNGQYITANFIPILNQEYTLEVVYNNEIYSAVETCMPVVNIDDVYQSSGQGFDKDALEVNVLFTDPVEIENFYLMKFQMQIRLQSILVSLV